MLILQKTIIPTMASPYVLFAIGLAAGIQQCIQWREIAPCTCKSEINSTFTTITCRGVSSYADVVTALQNKFTPNDRILLEVTHSKLEDLPRHAFKELNMSIENIKLNYDNLSNLTLSAYSFKDLPKVNYFSLSDNDIGFIPEYIFEKMPNIKTLDLGRIGVHHLKEGVFENLPQLQDLVLAGNGIIRLDKKSIPFSTRKLHLGRNLISDLNETLVHLTEMVWLFVNNNNISTLEGQLPPVAPNLIMIHAAHNNLDKLPNELKNYRRLQSLFMNNNYISALGTTIAHNRDLQRVQFEYNKISELSSETFCELNNLESLLLGHNRITSVNNVLHPLRKIRVVNFTHNLLTEFSLEEIKGLQLLETLDLSHNKIKMLYGPTANLVEWDARLSELKLNHNHLESLNGALSGLPGLLKLDLSHNKISTILPEDFIGLDHLRELDISHNRLKTLQEMSKTFLPSLLELIATHNQLTILDRDFHGLPILCWADLSSNQIVALGRELVANTKCAKTGTLKVFLQDNPIICDAALPEIVAQMEMNHTRIHGVTHCAPLSEQPTTSKPNGYLGILPSSTPIPLRNFDENPQPKVTPIFKQTSSYQPLTEQNQPPISVDYQPSSSNNKVNARAVESPPTSSEDLPQHNHLRHHSSHEEKDFDYGIRYTYKLSDYYVDQNSSHHVSTEKQNSVEEDHPVASINQEMSEEPLSEQQQLKQLATKVDDLKRMIEELSEIGRINEQKNLPPARVGDLENTNTSTGDVRTPK